MLNRPLLCTATLAKMCVVAFSLWSCQGTAASRDDPFATAELLRPPLSLAVGDEHLLQPCPAPPGRALVLADVVNLALCNNPQTREVWANARVQAAGVGRAEASYLPSLDGSLSAARSYSRGGALPAPVTRNERNYDLSLAWLIYDFGGRDAGLRNARELLDAANATQDATVQSLFFKAVQAYYQLQANQATRDASVDAEKAAGESLNAAEARYKVGAATPADKLQAQTAWSQATLNRISAEGNVKSAEGTLANVMGMSAAISVQLAPNSDMPPVTKFNAGVNELIAEASRRRPDLRAAEAQARAALAAADVARASGRPHISLGINGGETRGGGLPDAKNASLGVTLSIPLFSGFDTTYKVRAAEAQAEASAAQSARIKLQVALDVWNSFQALTTATQTISSSADLLASAEQSQRMALGRYKAGMGNILDVLNAQTALASARQQQVQALYNWNVTRVSLAQAMGTLDSGLIESLQESKSP